MPTAIRCRFVRTGNVFRRGLKALDANETSFGRIRSGYCLERVVGNVVSGSVRPRMLVSYGLQKTCSSMF